MVSYYMPKQVQRADKAEQAVLGQGHINKVEYLKSGFYRLFKFKQATKQAKPCFYFIKNQYIITLQPVRPERYLHENYIIF